MFERVACMISSFGAHLQEPLAFDLVMDLWLGNIRIGDTHLDGSGKTFVLRTPLDPLPIDVNTYS